MPISKRSSCNERDEEADERECRDDDPARVERETPKGLEGRIVQILERGSETIVGRFEMDSSGLGYVVPFDRRVLTDIQIPTGQSSSAEAGGRRPPESLRETSKP